MRARGRGLLRLALLALLACSCGRALGIPEGGEPVAGPVSSVADGDCAAMPNYAACEARSDCHGVYVLSDCVCAGNGPCGPCTVFDHCEDRGARCDRGRSNCDEPDPACTPPYTVGYDGDGFCAVGCVLKEKCD